MRDINFFKPYKGKDKGDNGKHYYQIMALTIGAVIIITFSINISKIIILNKEIENYQTELDREEIKEKVKESEKVNRELSALTKYDSDLDLIIDSIDKKDVVSNLLLDGINSTVPKNINFKSMNINNNILSIQAVSTNRQAIAEIQHNLKALDYVKDVHIESISTNESVQGEYSFNIKCYLKGGGN